MTIHTLSDETAPETRRVRRNLARLQVLLERRRVRAVAMRGVRGALGGGASFAALVKLKLADSLVLKGGLALLVGLCFAWPVVAGLLLALVLVVLAVMDAFEGEVPSCPDMLERLDATRQTARTDRRASRMARKPHRPSTAISPTVTEFSRSSNRGCPVR